jgi:hypothetical protein
VLLTWTQRLLCALNEDELLVLRQALVDLFLRRKLLDRNGLIFPVGHLEPRALSAFDDSRYSRVYDAPS